MIKMLLGLAGEPGLMALLGTAAADVSPKCDKRSEAVVAAKYRIHRLNRPAVSGRSRRGHNNVTGQSGYGKLLRVTNNRSSMLYCFIRSMPKIHRSPQARHGVQIDCT
jgi:hypothetical protein